MVSVDYLVFRAIKIYALEHMGTRSGSDICAIFSQTNGMTGRSEHVLLCIHRFIGRLLIGFFVVTINSFFNSLWVRKSLMWLVVIKVQHEANIDNSDYKKVFLS